MKTTTTGTAKQQVLDWVRSCNPQTMELKFGCRVGCDQMINESEATQVKKLIVDFIKDDVVFLHTFGVNAEEVGWEDVVEGYTILGSDMGLQELLIALDGHPRDCTASNYKGNFFEWRIFVDDETGEPCSWKEGGHNEYIRFDLTKNLHEQDEETFFKTMAKLILPLLPSP